MTSGIYIIQNTRSSVVYIGASVDIDRRWKEHRRSLAASRHHCKYLQRSWSKCGGSDFAFEILEECSTAEMVEAEQFWMDYLRWIGIVTFNSAPAAGSPLGFKHSEATKRKQSEAHKGVSKTAEHRKNIAQSLLGKHVSEETRRRLSEALKGREVPWSVGRVVSEETRQRLSDSHKGKRHTEESKQKMRDAHLKRRLP